MTPETTHISAQQMRYAVDTVCFVRAICAASAAAYSGSSPYAPRAPGSYRWGREVPAVAKRRLNPCASRTDYFAAVFNSILDARYRSHPMIWRAGRFAATRWMRSLRDSLLAAQSPPRAATRRQALFGRHESRMRREPTSPI